MQLRIFEIEIRLAHSALHAGNGVAHHAAKSGLRGGRVNNLLDGRIHFAAIKKGWIMASGAPFRRLGAYRVLHVLDALAIPLIVEGCKMMRRAEPLLIDVLM